MARLKSKSYRNYKNAIPVYDISVRNNENFIANGILNHNCGYNHGETSVLSAGSLMAATWSNNIPLVEGQGSFGTRLVQEAGAPRYIKTKLHSNFEKYIKDVDISPEHEDPEHEPPKFYVPIIPLVLVNGVKGIGTGFATNILPRDPKSVAKACSEYIKNGSIKKRPPIKFPDFDGKVELGEDGKFYGYGILEKISQTKYMITEVPYGYDRESYVKILDKLENDDKIVRYVDMSDSSGFKFEVTLKRGKIPNKEQLMKMFKLVKSYTENITVVDINDTIKTYDDERELIKDFCEWRLNFLNKRIKNELQKCVTEYGFLSAKKEFIELVLDNKITFKGKSKKEIEEQILSYLGFDCSHVEKLLSIRVYSLTKESVDELEKQLIECKETLEYWKTISNQELFLEELK